jgi:light-regulated signal transduction histidine kinase (bacteriophytochrome)
MTKIFLESDACKVEKALLDIVKLAPTSVALFDLNLCYLSVSSTWGKDLGLVYDTNMLGKSYYDVFPSQPKHWEQRFEKCLKGETFAGEMEPVTGVDGIRSWLAMHIIPWTNTNGSIGGVLIYTHAMIDRMAEKRESDANLEKMIENLKRSNAELERFAHSCSHDLKEPLRSVSGFVQLLLRHNSGEFDEISIDYIQHILKGLDRMGSLIKDILSYSRVTTQMDKHSMVGLKEILDGINNDLIFNLQEAGANIHIGEMPVVMGNATKMKQLFTNLIENAIKFRSSQPLVIDISAKDLGSFWEISVADNGIGIEKQYQKSIFDMFKRLNSKNRYEGSGIGLSITKKIVTAHGGNILVRSNPTGGSEFAFTLPKMKMEE